MDGAGTRVKRVLAIKGPSALLKGRAWSKVTSPVNVSTMKASSKSRELSFE